MTNWKKAFQLIKFELRKSVFNILVSYLVSLLFTTLFIRQMPSYLENGTVLYDFLFVFVFGISPLFPKPKSFESQHVQYGFLVSPVVIVHKRLPIPDNIILKGRIIMHFFYTFPIQLVALIILYLATSLHNILTIGSFIAFAFIWLAFSICIGYLIPRLSIGARGFWYTNSGLGIILLISGFVLFFVLTLIYTFFGNGLVYWTITFAKDFPILSAGISIIIGLMGYCTWTGRMRRSMQKISYT